MIALDGRIVAQGPNGRREIPMKDFVLGPFTNALAYNEIAVEAIIPAAKGTAKGGYLKLERRVKLLRSSSLDLDMLDEQARRVLGVIGPEDVVIVDRR